MIDELVSDLARDEGWRAEPYQDHLGFWTIGYGFLIDGRKPVELPKEVGDFWLKYLAKERMKALEGRYPWLSEQPDDVRRALGNMAYQLGIRGLSRFVRTLAFLQAGNRGRAAQEALDSNWAKQTPERAKRIAKLLAGE